MQRNRRIVANRLKHARTLLSFNCTGVCEALENFALFIRGFPAVASEQGCQTWLEGWRSDEVHNSPRLGWADLVSCGPGLREIRGMGQDSMRLLLLLCACQSGLFLLCSSISFLVLPAVPCGPVLLVPTMHDRRLTLCLCSLTGFFLHTVCQWRAYFSNSVYHFFPFQLSNSEVIDGLLSVSIFKVLNDLIVPFRILPMCQQVFNNVSYILNIEALLSYQAGYWTLIFPKQTASSNFWSIWITSDEQGSRSPCTVLNCKSV